MDTQVYIRSMEIHTKRKAEGTHYGWMGLLNPAIVSCDKCLDEAEKELNA